MVIFCGGTGTRMREETEFRPKPMVEVGGRPIVWHIMKGYAQHGFKKFILCLGYKAWMIKDYFLTHQFAANDFTLNLGTHAAQFTRPEEARDDFEITFVDTGAEALTSERLLRVGYLLQNKPFMVTYGDGVSDVSIQKLVEHHIRMRETHGVIGTLTGIHPKSKYGLVLTDDQDRVTRFAQYPQLPDYTNGGFMVFEPEFLAHCRAETMVEDTIIEVANLQKMALYRHEGFWHCMDTVKDKEDLEKLWKTDPAWKTW